MSKHEGNEGESQAENGGNGFPGKENCQCNGPNAGIVPGLLEEEKEASKGGGSEQG